MKEIKCDNVEPCPQEGLLFLPKLYFDFFIINNEKIMSKCQELDIHEKIFLPNLLFSN